MRMIKNYLLPLHADCIYRDSQMCKKCIIRSKFKPTCESCLFWTIPITKICITCMYMKGGTHQYFEEML